MRLQLHRTSRFWKEPSKSLSKVISYRLLTVWQFIDSLTQQTNWAGGSLKPQKHGVRHVELKNSDLPGTVILLDTPGFDDPYKPVIEVVQEVEGWLQCER